jgi:hypothetical protein
MKKTAKSDHCWDCGERLDQPYKGRSPEAHRCRTRGCVVCPRCESALCEYDSSAKRAKAEQFREMAKSASAHKPAPSDGSDGSTEEEIGKHLPAVERFPTDVLPGPLARYVREAAKAINCPEDYVGVAVLGLAGSAIGNTRVIEVRRGWQEKAATWIAMLGDPGSKKSPVLRQGTKPFEERQLELQARFQETCREHKAKEPADGRPTDGPGKEPRAGATRPASGSASPREADRPDESKEPVLERCYTSYTTVEAMVVLLRQNPRGLALIHDELAAWTLSMNQYRKGKGSDRQTYMSTWSGALITQDRKGEPRPLIAPDPFLSILGCLCPGMLNELEEEKGREDGFADRMLFCYPDPVPFAPWTEETISDDAERAWRETLGRLWGLDAPRDQGRFRPEVVRLDPEAKRVWEEFFNRHGREMAEADFPTHLKGVWSKLQGYTLRLALILHELRLAAGEDITEGMVDAETMRRAVALTDYFATHADRVHARMARKREVAPADADLLEAVEKHVEANSGTWQGTAAALLEALNADSLPRAQEAKGWPKSPPATGKAMRRLKTRLETEKGIEVTFEREKDRERTRIILLKKLSELSEPSGGDPSGEAAQSCVADGLAQGTGTPPGTVRNGQRQVRTVPGDEAAEPQEPSTT